MYTLEADDQFDVNFFVYLTLFVEHQHIMPGSNLVEFLLTFYFV